MLVSFLRGCAVRGNEEAAAASPPPAGGVQLGPAGRCRRGSSGSTVNDMDRTVFEGRRRAKEPRAGTRSWLLPADRLGGAQVTAALNTKPRYVASTTSSENGSSTS